MPIMVDVIIRCRHFFFINIWCVCFVRIRICILFITVNKKANQQLKKFFLKKKVKEIILIFKEKKKIVWFEGWRTMTSLEGRRTTLTVQMNEHPSDDIHFDVKGFKWRYLLIHYSCTQQSRYKVHPSTSQETLRHRVKWKIIYP